MCRLHLSTIRHVNAQGLAGTMLVNDIGAFHNEYGCSPRVCYGLGGSNCNRVQILPANDVRIENVLPQHMKVECMFNVVVRKEISLMPLL
jgi:hypothetical protein